MAYKNTEVTWKSQQFSVKLANLIIVTLNFLYYIDLLEAFFAFNSIITLKIKF